MEGIIDKENERVRRFFALLDNMEKKVEHLARDNRPPFNGERFLTDRELSGTLRISLLLTGTIRNDESMEAVIEKICFSSQLTYKKNGSHYLLMK